MTWLRRFDEPIATPRKPITTLKDAADYIRRLPKAEIELPHWRAAIEALILAAEDRGPVMHARIGMLRAMNENAVREFSDRKGTHWGKRKLKRDA